MLLDTSACIEFFLGSEKGEKVKKVVESEICYINIITLAEVTKWCFKNAQDIEKHINAIRKAVAIINLNDTICVLAGKITSDVKKTMKNFGLIDGLIAATAKIYGLQIMTGDKHFIDFGAEIL